MDQNQTQQRLTDQHGPEPNTRLRLVLVHAGFSSRAGFRSFVKLLTVTSDICLSGINRHLFVAIDVRMINKSIEKHK